MASLSSRPLISASLPHYSSEVVFAHSICATNAPLLTESAQLAVPLLEALDVAIPLALLLLMATPLLLQLVPRLVAFALEHARLFALGFDAIGNRARGAELRLESLDALVGGRETIVGVVDLASLVLFGEALLSNERQARLAESVPEPSFSLG